MPHRKQHHPTSRLIAALLLPLLAGVLAAPAAALELASPFADHAVLQRGKPVPVWGWSEPGTKITVQFAGQTETTTTGDNGKWMLDLEPLEASFEPRTLTVKDNKGNRVAVEDVLVGEVWLAAGQSNMQWIAGKSDVGRTMLPRVMERVEAGEIPKPVIREGKVTNYYAAPQPVEHADLEWSSEMNGFSAISLAFALTLAQELNVPIGILNSAFSTTQIQTWVPREGFAAGESEYTQNIYKKTLMSVPGTPEHEKAWGDFYQQIKDTIELNKQLVAQGKEPQAISTGVPGNYAGNRDATWMYNARINPLVPYAIRGGIWNQGYASQNEGLRYYDNLHSLVRGWRTVWGDPDLPVYFHQFYRAGNSHDGSIPAMGGTNEMRLATWLAAQDIPNADFASQIDIGGSIHYGNKSRPGMRFARLALKNQYDKDIVAHGPMFKSYSVSGNKVTVTLDHAQGGLVVAEPDPKDLAKANVIEDGEDRVNLFYIADENKVWYPATFQIKGSQVVVTADGVDDPRGIAYAVSGVGFQPNLYNKALLPTTPFIYYDHKLVTSETWPEDALKVHGVEPKVAGLEYDYRKMPLLSTQFRDNAVLQAGQPVTIWGSAVHRWVHFGAEDKRTDEEAVVHFSFGDIKKTIPVTDDMLEWQVTLPTMPAGDKAYTLHVKFTINGEVIHERKAENIVFGDVWYVAAPPGDYGLPVEASHDNVRMMERKAKRSSANRPSRFSIAVSTTPENRFASVWQPAKGFAAALGNRIAEKTGKPVGIIFMDANQSRKEDIGPALSSWIAPQCLNQAPSLMEDYQQLAALRPGNEYYQQNAMRYIQAWQNYWNQYIPEMIATGAVPDEKAWGSYPTFAAEVTTKAAETYNVMTLSFTPASLTGIVFIAGPGSVEQGKGQHFGEQITALANCWKDRFDSENTRFFYTLPSQELAPQASPATGIQGHSEVIQINSWPTEKEPNGQMLNKLINQVVSKSYE